MRWIGAAGIGKIEVVSASDQFARHYLFVDVPGPATSESVAELLDAAAALRRHGLVDVHHLAFDATDCAHGTATSLTIYYDRVERREYPRE